MHTSPRHSHAYRAGRIVAATTVAIGLAFATLTPTAASAAPVDGARTSTDSLFPNVGNGGYDVKHYDVDLSYDFTSKAIDAETTITATASSELSSFSLDLEGLTVNSVTVDGAAAAFTRDIDAATTKYKLIITPASPVSGEFTTVVDYSGVPTSHIDPDDSTEGWVQTADGATAVGEPVGTMTWLPSNNVPTDKATFDIDLTVPTTITGGSAAGVSNGELESKTVSEDGLTTTWSWSQKNQMATYLALVSIGKYDVLTSDITLASGRTIPEWSFVDSSISSGTKTTINTRRASIKPIIDFIETKLGAYPGNSTGVVVDVTSLGYALETQDRSYFERSISAGTLVHELAHQWTGNAVTLSDWSDIWLNEGPATYFEGYYNFGTAAPGTVVNSPERARYTTWSANTGTYGPSSSFWKTPVAGFTDPADLFGSPTYSRGAMTLGALSVAISDQTLDQLFLAWMTKHHDGDASTADFIALAKEISGRDLDAFFQDWLYDTDKPAWPAEWTAALSSSITNESALLPGDSVDVTLSATNTGFIALTDGVVTVDASELLEEVVLDELPVGVTQTGTTLTWTVPATALSATSTVTITGTVRSSSSGGSAKITAKTSNLGTTFANSTLAFTTPEQPVSPSATPTVSGTASVGSTLTAIPGAWADGTAFTYQWLSGGTVIPGSTGATFVPAVSDLGAAISVSVTGSLAKHIPVTVTSAVSTIGEGTLTTATPTVSGSATVGATLTAAPGSWTAGTGLTYQWFSAGTAIPAATGATIAVPANAVGKTITVEVTGTLAGYSTASTTSEPTKAVAKGTLKKSKKVSVKGTVKIGKTLRSSTTSWGAGTKATYTWYAGSAVVKKSSSSTLGLKKAYRGKKIKLVVTISKAGYSNLTVRSSSTAKVK